VGNLRGVPLLPYLQKQWNTYYAVWDIPQKDRIKFNGKRRLTKTLKTENKKMAQRRAYAQVEEWKRLAEGSFWDRERANYPEAGEPYAIGNTSELVALELDEQAMKLGISPFSEEHMARINAIPDGEDITVPFNPQKHMTERLPMLDSIFFWLSPKRCNQIHFTQ
jgi:hypothetical protein